MQRAPRGGGSIEWRSTGTHDTSIDPIQPHYPTIYEPHVSITWEHPPGNYPPGDEFQASAAFWGLGGLRYRASGSLGLNPLN